MTASSTGERKTPLGTEDRDVVIFDGHCRFCQRQIERLRQLDVRHQLEFLSLHSLEVAERYPDIPHERLMSEMAIVSRDGKRLFGAAALRHLTRRLRVLWCLAPLLHLPFTAPLWSWLYRQFARRRYLFGRVETCEDGRCEVHGSKGR